MTKVYTCMCPTTSEMIVSTSRQAVKKASRYMGLYGPLVFSQRKHPVLRDIATEMEGRFCNEKRYH